MDRDAFSVWVRDGFKLGLVVREGIRIINYYYLAEFTYTINTKTQIKIC